MAKNVSSAASNNGQDLTTQLSQLEEQIRNLHQALAQTSGTPASLHIQRRPPKKKARVRGVFDRYSDGTYWIRYADATGKQHYEKVGPKATANELYRQRKEQVRLGKFEPEEIQRKHRRNVTVAQMIDEYIESCEANQLRDLRNIYSRSKFWKEQIGDRPAKSILPADVERSMKVLAGRRFQSGGHKTVKPGGRAKATINRYLALLKTAFSRAIEDRRLAHSPFDAIKLHKANNKRVRWLADDEEQRLFAIVKDPIDRAKIEVALDTGMRAQEQWQLKWGDIDFRQEILTVRDSKSGEGRHIPINANLLQILRSLPRRLDNPYVFCGRKAGERVTDKPKNWEKWLAAANIQNFHWHDLRHTFASRLVMKGANLYDVQKLLGHKTIEMTMRYAHLSPDHLKKTVNLLVQVNQEAARKTGSE